MIASFFQQTMRWTAVLGAFLASALTVQLAAQTTASSVAGPVEYWDEVYTTVPKLFLLEKGMSLETVVTTLQCEPSAVIQHTEGGYLMLEWKYLHQNRWVSSKMANRSSGRTQGEDYWLAPASVYVLFNNDLNLVSYITEEGMANLKDAHMWQAAASAQGLIRSQCIGVQFEAPAAFKAPVVANEVEPERKLFEMPAAISNVPAKTAEVQSDEPKKKNKKAGRVILLGTLGLFLVSVIAS
jgi:hypothetical protein